MSAIPARSFCSIILHFVCFFLERENLWFLTNFMDLFDFFHPYCKKWRESKPPTSCVPALSLTHRCVCFLLRRICHEWTGVCSGTACGIWNTVKMRFITIFLMNGEVSAVASCYRPVQPATTGSWMSPLHVPVWPESWEIRGHQSKAKPYPKSLPYLLWYGLWSTSKMQDLFNR